MAFTEKKKKHSMIWWVILLLCLLFLVVSVVVAWVVISHERYTTLELKSGETYKVADRVYVFPSFQHIEGKPLLLKENIIEGLRKLLWHTTQLFQSCEIPYHVTGGTLLGIVRHKAVPMPFDDDIDLCVDYAHREFLFSKAFQEEAAKHDLTAIYLFGSSLQRADRHGSAVRLQLRNSEDKETLDIFFWRMMADGKKIAKVDGWSGDAVFFNSKEQFSVEDVFPRTLMKVDGLDLMMPHNPVALLHQQYGPDVLTSARVRPRLVSHAFPMRFLRSLWLPHI